VPGTVLMVSQPGDAGVAHVVADQVGWAAAAGWKCVVACDPESRLAYLTRNKGGQVAVWCAKRSPARGLMAEVAALRQIVDQSDPDLVHLHSSKAGLIGRLTVRGRRATLFQPHAWSFQAASSLQGALAVQWERYAKRWTDTTVCVSRAEQNHGASAGLTGGTLVLPNAVDTRRFHPLEKDSRAWIALRCSLGIPPDRPLALCLGRICAQKGQDMLLAAWTRVIDLLPDATLVLVGDGPDRDLLAARAPASVKFVGSVEDPVPWLQAADLVVVPSRWEGQALVVLEAMACGTAVVASNIEPNIEVLPPTAGKVVSVSDPKPFALAIADRLGALGRLLGAAEGEAGRECVISHHNPSYVAEQLVELYEGMLGDAGRPSTGLGRR
jgi:glycosyltransferase involved in cell wall biosynthesis